MNHLPLARLLLAVEADPESTFYIEYVLVVLVLVSLLGAILYRFSMKILTWFFARFEAVRVVRKELEVHDDPEGPDYLPLSSDGRA